MKSEEGRPIHRRAADGLKGLGEGFRRERAVRTHLIFSAASLIMLIWVRPALAWTLTVAVLLVLGLTVELINGAVEASLDRLHPRVDSEIGAAKDMASAAAFVINCAAVTAAIGALVSTL